MQLLQLLGYITVVQYDYSISLSVVSSLILKKIELFLRLCDGVIKITKGSHTSGPSTTPLPAIAAPSSLLLIPRLFFQITIVITTAPATTLFL